MANRDASLPGIPSLRGFAKCVSQPRVIKAVSWKEWRGLQGRLLDDTRYATKTVMARRVYAKLFEPCTQVPLTHTGWHLQPGDTITVANDPTDGVPLSGRFMTEQMQVLKLWSRPGLPIEGGGFSMPEANILVRFADLDGKGGNLGMTLRYREGDLGRGGQQVIVTIDTSEHWTSPYFFTVFAHEIGHALGHAHYRLGNIMHGRFTGNRLLLGRQDSEFHREKYDYLELRSVDT